MFKGLSVFLLFAMLLMVFVSPVSAQGGFTVSGHLYEKVGILKAHCEWDGHAFCAVLEENEVLDPSCEFGIELFDRDGNWLCASYEPFVSWENMFLIPLKEGRKGAAFYRCIEAREEDLWYDGVEVVRIRRCSSFYSIPSSHRSCFGLHEKTLREYRERDAILFSR